MLVWAIWYWQLVKAADEAEAGKEGREERALDIIKRLDAFPITMDLLINTEAAKVLRHVDSTCQSDINKSTHHTTLHLLS